MLPGHTNKNSVALKNGHIRIVCASILGSVLVNLLLILGTALLAVSMGSQENSYSPAATPLLGSLLFVSVLAFLMPVSRTQSFTLWGVC
jgi:Ca2+:H+ antiporter